jgi:hypothetical protein
MAFYPFIVSTAPKQFTGNNFWSGNWLNEKAEEIFGAQLQEI